MARKGFGVLLLGLAFPSSACVFAEKVTDDGVPGAGGAGAGGAAGGAGAAGAGGQGGMGGGGASTGGQGGTGGTATFVCSKAGSDPANPEWANWCMPNPTGPNATDYDASTPTPEETTDRVTGLIWQRGESPTTRTQAQAVTYCADSTTGNVPANTWRLPSRIELVSIVDPSLVNPSLQTAENGPFNEPIIDTAQFWTSTQSASTQFFAVDFSDGDVIVRAASENLYVRCVRDPGSPPNPAPLEPHYQVEDEVVTDLRTGLVWERDASPIRFFVADGEDHCEGLTKGPANAPWRVPSMKELQTIFDEAKREQPAFSATAMFTGGSPECHYRYLSSSLVPNTVANPWLIEFDNLGSPGLPVRWTASSNDNQGATGACGFPTTPVNLEHHRYPVRCVYHLSELQP